MGEPTQDLEGKEKENEGHSFSHSRKCRILCGCMMWFCYCARDEKIAKPRFPLPQINGLLDGMQSSNSLHFYFFSKHPENPKVKQDSYLIFLRRMYVYMCVFVPF